MLKRVFAIDMERCPVCKLGRNNAMALRIAAIAVSHWHALDDATYLRTLARLPDVQFVGLQDPAPDVAAHCAAEVGNTPTCTDYRQMLDTTRPDFVLALGRPRVMAETAHYLIDHGYPFLMEKPMGVNAEDVRRLAEKATATQRFAAVPLAQRYQPFVARAHQLLAAGRFGPVSHRSCPSTAPPRPAIRPGDRPGCSIPLVPAAGAPAI